jgi:hypothetical protein
MGLADGAEPDVVKVTLRDGLGKPFSGGVVHLHASGGSSAILAPTSTTTDSNGVAMFSVTDRVPETVTYFANAEQGSKIVRVSGTTTVEFAKPVPDPLQSSMSVHEVACLCGDTQVGPQPHIATVTARDAFGIPVEGVQLAIVSDPDPTFTPPNSVTPSVVATDANGIAIFNLILDVGSCGVRNFKLLAKTIAGNIFVVASYRDGLSWAFPC